jgi:hypothetical protein
MRVRQFVSHGAHRDATRHCPGHRHRRRPPLPPRRSGFGTRRPPPTHRGYTMARPGDGHRSVPGRAAGDAPGARALLGDGLRLAEGGGDAERPAAVRDRDGRGRHPVRARPVPASERAAADHDPRLARLRRRTPEGHWSAHRSHRAWRSRGGRRPSRARVDAQLRLLGQANGVGLGSRPDGARLGRAHEAAGVHPLRLTGRRLGHDHLRSDGGAGATGPAGHPHQHAGGGAA